MIKKIIGSLLAVCMMVSVGSTVFAGEVEGEGTYQQMIDEVNGMFNSEIAIPAENYSEVYSNLSKYTPSEFKRKLIKDYEEALAIMDLDDYNVTIEYDKPTTRYSETTMVASWGAFEARGNYFGRISVKVGLENNPYPIFVKYLSSSHSKYNDRVHYRPLSAAHTIQNGYRELQLNCTGMYYTGEGIALTGIINKYITYYADGSSPYIL